ncbi:MAG: efflux transporter outer rane subunit [Massilia sp.]|nr:efflux transporter outer rane subunit [Massilia sp.]
MPLNPKLKITAASAAALLAGLLAGCGTVGPDYRIPADAAVNRPAASAPLLGAAEAPFAASPLPSDWWRLYRDPTLDRLVKRALAANTDLRVAAANLARVRALQQEVEVAAGPAVGFNAAPAYGRGSAAAKGLGEPLTAGFSHDAGVNVAYQVDLFGKIARAVEAAGADTQAAQAGYDVARVTVVADTARAYVDACAAARQMTVAQQSVDLQAKFVELTGQRVRGGRGTALDTSRARGLLEQLRSAIPTLRAQQRGAQFRLAALTGEVPAALSELSTQVAQCKVAPRLTSLIPVGDGAALLRRRPDIRQAERALASASARIGVAVAELYPSISLGLSAGSTGTLAQFGASNAMRWSLGPLISWSLPSTGSAHSRIAQAEAGSALALAHFDGAVLTALRDVETALTVYARELDRHAALTAAREQDALASNQARTLFRAGRTDFLTTLDADRTLATAEASLAQSEAQLSTDQVNLFLALGGGWEQPGK